MRMTLAATLLLCAGGVSAQDFFTLKGHGGPIMGLSVASDGRIATASFDNSVGVWDAAHRPTWHEGHDAAVTAVAFSHAPALISGADDFRVLLWHPDLDRPTEVTRHKGKVSDVTLSPDGRVIASASWDGSVHLVPVDLTAAPPVIGKAQMLTGHRSGVNAVAFAPSGALVSSSTDGTVLIWQPQGDAFLSRPIVSHGFGVNELIVTRDWIAYGAVDGGTRIVTHEGDEIADFTLDRRPILALAHHPATGQLAVGDGQGYIMMVDTASWQITRDFRATRAGPVWALGFSTDGATILAGGIDDIAYGWPVASLDLFSPGIAGDRSFLRKAETMPNGERQFMRKCSICHALGPGPSRKAGPTLHGLFGRAAGAVPDYPYSETLDGSDIIWTEETIDALFDMGPDHYIPGSKMPMQVIAEATDRADLVTFLKTATTGNAQP